MMNKRFRQEQIVPLREALSTGFDWIHANEESIFLITTVTPAGCKFYPTFTLSICGL